MGLGLRRARHCPGTRSHSFECIWGRAGCEVWQAVLNGAGAAQGKTLPRNKITFVALTTLEDTGRFMMLMASLRKFIQVRSTSTATLHVLLISSLVPYGTETPPLRPCMSSSSAPSCPMVQKHLHRDPACPHHQLPRALWYSNTSTATLHVLIISSLVPYGTETPPLRPCMSSSSAPSCPMVQQHLHCDPACPHHQLPRALWYRNTSTATLHVLIISSLVPYGTETPPLRPCMSSSSAPSCPVVQKHPSALGQKLMLAH